MASFLEQMQKVYGDKLPASYAKLMSGAKAVRTGRFVAGVPSFKPALKLEVDFEAKKLLDVWKVHGVKTALVPIGVLKGEDGILAIDLAAKGNPVSVWSEGTFLKFKPSLDALLAALIGKADKPPLAVLEAAIEKAKKLRESKQHAKILTVIDEAIGALTPDSFAADDPARKRLAEAFQYRGLALAGLDRDDEAIAAYRLGFACGTKSGFYAALNLCSKLLARGDHAGVIEVGTQLIDNVLDEPVWFHSRYYLILAYLGAGNAKAAEKLAKVISKDFAKDAEKLAKMADGIRETSPGSPLLALFEKSKKPAAKKPAKS